MANKVTRGVDIAAHYVGWVVDLPSKGAYAVALLCLLAAYGIHTLQVEDSRDKLEQVRTEKREQRTLDNKKIDETEQPPLGSNSRC